MSAQPRETTTSDATADDVPPDINSYPIDIPAAFIEGFAGDTVAEKLINAEAAPPAEPTAEYQYADLTAADPAATTTVAVETDGDDAPTCVRCGAKRLSPKGNGTQSQRKAGDYVCETCRTHQSHPEHPEIAEIEFADSQTQLGRWSE
jgi:hypothetical protein